MLYIFPSMFLYAFQFSNYLVWLVLGLLFTYFFHLFFSHSIIVCSHLFMFAYLHCLIFLHIEFHFLPFFCCIQISCCSITISSHLLIFLNYLALSAIRFNITISYGMSFTYIRNIIGANSCSIPFVTFLHFLIPLGNYSSLLCVFHWNHIFPWIFIKVFYEGPCWKYFVSLGICNQPIHSSLVSSQSF